MSGLFEHLSADDEYAAKSRRKFAAVVYKRLDDRLGDFLRTASNRDDFNARVALIDDDLEHVIAQTADEYLESLSAERLAEVKASFLERSSAGGFCDDCRKWKTGPKAGCTCGDSDSDSDSDSDDESTDKEASFRTADQIELATEPIMYQQPLSDEPGEGVIDINGELAEAPSAVGSGVTSAMLRARQLMASVRSAADVETGDSTEKREKVTQPAGPSPKIDKRTWKPNALNENGNLKPIKTEGDGSPHPTTQQDVKDTPDWENDEFVPKTLTESVELDTADDDGAGFATGGEEHGDHTKTWSGTEGQAEPVSRASAKQDVDKNPLRTKLEEWASPDDVDAQIMAWENRD